MDGQIKELRDGRMDRLRNKQTGRETHTEESKMDRQRDLGTDRLANGQIQLYIKAEREKER
jgi:hypothetical protein